MSQEPLTPFARDTVQPWANSPMTMLEADAFHYFHADRIAAATHPTFEVVDLRAIWQEQACREAWDAGERLDDPAALLEALRRQFVGDDQ